MDRHGSDRQGKFTMMAAIAVVALLTLGMVLAPPPSNPCRDGVDNDGDGFIDWPADDGCASRHDDTEERSRVPCAHGSGKDAGCTGS